MAMTIQELREKRNKAWDTARDFLDSKRNANGVLSEEDSKTYDAMEQTIVDLGKESQRLERQAEIEAEMNKATSTPVLGKPATPNVTEKTGTASDTYKKAFWNSIRNRNWIDVHDDLHIGTDAEGGYLVPDTILNRPYKTSSYVPEIKAGNKCMAFGDFSYYWVADRQGRSFKRLNELFAMTGQVGFLASRRLDGKLILPEAIKTPTIKKA